MSYDVKQGLRAGSHAAQALPAAARVEDRARGGSNRGARDAGAAAQQAGQGVIVKEGVVRCRIKGGGGGQNVWARVAGMPWQKSRCKLMVSPSELAIHPILPGSAVASEAVGGGEGREGDNENPIRLRLSKWQVEVGRKVSIRRAGEHAC